MEAQHKSAQKTMGRNTFIIMTVPMARFLSESPKNFQVLMLIIGMKPPVQCCAVGCL